MTLTTTTAYRTLVARAIMGDAVVMLPTTLKLGTGHFSGGVLVPPTPSETDLATAVITGVALTVTRVGALVRCTAEVIGGATPYDITEAGLFTADGTMVLIDVFRPRTLTNGLTFDFRYTLIPEVN